MSQRRPWFEMLSAVAFCAGLWMIGVGALTAEARTVYAGLAVTLGAVVGFVAAELDWARRERRRVARERITRASRAYAELCRRCTCDAVPENPRDPSAHQHNCAVRLEWELRR